MVDNSLHGSQLKLSLKTLTPALLRTLLDYDPATGVICWRVAPSRRNKAGEQAGSLSHGYRRIKIGTLRLAAHRVAWALFYGAWPKLLDHVDGDPANNRIANLRLATPGQNKANSVAQSKHGVKGIWRETRKRSKPWGAQIWRDGALRNLGMFATKAEAAAAVAVAHRALHGEFSFTAGRRPAADSGGMLLAGEQPPPGAAPPYTPPKLAVGAASDPVA